MSAFGRAAARALEAGSLRGPLAQSLARVWETLAEPVRPARLPQGARVIGVGGATLGGSGKTPVVLELARCLGKNSVAVVAHGYRARIETARRLSPDDAARTVGDDAALLARALAPDGIAVIGGRERSSALALAASLAPRVIVDGLLQARPARLALSILVLDAAEPWGSAACPPCGDLRAARQRLLAAADVVLLLEQSARPPAAFALERALRARSELCGAVSAAGRQLDLRELGRLRLGVVLAVARPARILDELRAHGIQPARLELLSDHAVPRAPRRGGVDGWLTTAKCATKLGTSFGGAPVWTLSHRVRLPEALVRLAIAPPQKAVIESAPCFPTES